MDLEFDELVFEATACRSCSRMAGSACVIGRASGRIPAPVMFVGEAPGRLGADSSLLPFHGDKAGENFESLIEHVGLSRHDAFVTNAVLCNPKDERGNNATPTRVEIENCSQHLRRQIELVSPRIVVTLGAQALAALAVIQPHQIKLAEAVRTAQQWNGRLLVPMYHPGQRAMIHRSYLNQLADYQFLAEQVRRVAVGPRRHSGPPTSETVTAIVRSLLQEAGEVSYFALHKLYYLLEYEYAKRFGQRLTQSYVVRQKDGPYVVELNIKRLRKALPELRVSEAGGRLLLSFGSDGFFDERERQRPDIERIIEYVVRNNAARSDADLKRVVYLTAPMRRLLRYEKYNGRNMFNAPVDFLNSASKAT